MQKKILHLITIVFLIITATVSKSQTVLAPGDLAFIGMNESSDGFSLVTFVDICPCTVIYFTDNPYKNATGFCTSKEEFCISLTVTSIIPQGAIITYTEGSDPGTFSFTSGAGTLAPAFTSTAGTNYGFSKDNGGDNCFAFQGTYTAPNFICGIKNYETWTASGAVSCTNKSHTELPSQLTNGVNALAIIKSGGCEGAKYNCTVVSGSKSTISSAIYNQANWTLNSNSSVSLPPGCTFSVTPAVSATCGCILPVELTSFKATSNEPSVKIEWTTPSENNNKNFEIERSADGNIFENIGTISGNGNSTIEHQYSFTDDNPLAGNNYYRLKQNDFNGSFIYSQVISVKIKKNISFSIVPNPANDFFIISFGESGQKEIFIYNSFGAKIKNIISIESEIKINRENIPPGFYFVEVKNEIGLVIGKSKLLFQ